MVIIVSLLSKSNKLQTFRIKKSVETWFTSFLGFNLKTFCMFIISLQKITWMWLVLGPGWVTILLLLLLLSLITKARFMILHVGSVIHWSGTAFRMFTYMNSRQPTFIFTMLNYVSWLHGYQINYVRPFLSNIYSILTLNFRYQFLIILQVRLEQQCISAKWDNHV